ncbi:MAG: hypothetical protein AAF564_15010 [Bacteroidota bacterium]
MRFPQLKMTAPCALLGACLCVCLFAATPATAQKDNYTSQLNITKNGKKMYQVKKLGYALEFESKGVVELNKSDTDVASITPGGYLEISEKEWRTRRQVRIESSRSGALTYRYKLNGKEKDFAEIDRDWYEDMLVKMIRETGVGASERTKRILNNDGVAGVFSEIAKIISSSARVAYMTALFEQAKLDDRQLLQASKLVKDIPSSGDRSRFLKWAAPQYVASEKAAPYFFDAVESIPSSGDKTRVLTSLVEDELLDNETSYLEAIRVANSIPSSGDRSRFLIKAADLYIDEAADYYFEAINGIPSSGDKTRVLTKLVESGALENDEAYMQALAAAKHIPSSGDRSRFLIAAIGTYPPTASDAYFDVVNSLPSSGDHARVLMKFAQDAQLTRAGMEAYLASAQKISSSGDKTRALLAVAGKVAGDEDLVDAYLEAADTIPSSGDYKRALSALMD